MSRNPIDDDNNTNDAEHLAPENAAAAATEEGELDKIRAERDSLFERLARVSADFQNTRKRLEADKEQAVQYANGGLIKNLLPVIDNFERALAVDPAKTDAAAILKGMQIVHDQWLKVLKQQEVEDIAPKPGDAFNPNQHEALMQQESDGKIKPGHVTQLLQKGYALHGRTLRPAQVAVAKSS